MESREPVARSDTNKEPSGNKSSGAPKVAATYSPTTQCSTIGDAELNDPVSLCCPRPLRSAALRSLLRPRAAGAHSPHPTPSATADTARASEAGLAMSNAG